MNANPNLHQSQNQTQKQNPRRARRSLRSILIFLFVLFSVVPLAFVTGYSVVQYEQAIDNELTERLFANAREISNTFNEIKSNMAIRRIQYEKDQEFLTSLRESRTAKLRDQGSEWLKAEVSDSLTIYGAQGRMLVSLNRDVSGAIKDITPKDGQVLVLSADNLLKLKEAREYQFVEYSKPGKFSLILLSRIGTNAKRPMGYLQQTLDLDPVYLSKLKDKMKLELMVLRSNGAVSTGTLRDFAYFKKGTFEKYTKTMESRYFELAVRGESHGFLIYPMTWGNSDFFIALGASKAQSRAVLANVNTAFFIVVGAIILLLIIVISLTSQALVKPIWELVDATNRLQIDENHIEIPTNSDTELGLLTESFNRMSFSISRTKTELKDKIAELEKANKEIQDTQSRLVHNSKMVSLGQMIAGVAHELNNPIGFIYSNMEHLKDYSDRLLQYGDRVRKNPDKFQEIESELEIEYVRKDLPKLIASCLDGAKRTRDIVLGLRNFSRLESAQIKDLNVHEAIDSTLNLLKGETKERITIERKFGSLPPISCNASQINQVFMNLLTNAVQAIEGPGTIWISTQLVEERSKIPKVKISIQDSGKGISPENLDKIFDPFFSTKEIGQGTGLGLSITFSIVRSHGGEIQVKSQVGSGTEFIVYLPIEIQAQAT